MFEAVRSWNFHWPALSQDPIRDRLQTVTVPLDRTYLPEDKPLEWAVLQAPDGTTFGTMPCEEDGVSTTLGRDDLATVQIRDQYVHRRHARVRWDDIASAHVLEDLGGANGTYLNGHRVLYPRRLRDGDHIRLGVTSLLYRRQFALALAATGRSYDGDADSMTSLLAIR